MARGAQQIPFRGEHVAFTGKQVTPKPIRVRIVDGGERGAKQRLEFDGVPLVHVHEANS
jgi:hypothetical protein